jgi:hypothetical protein
VRKDRQLWAVDCETDPAKYGRVPVPFIWGAYNGSEYLEFYSTIEFVEWARKQHAIIYAHNGGKFDFMFLLVHIGSSKAQVINGRIVKMMCGKAELRDSVSIIPEKLAKFGKFEFDYRKLEASVRHLHKEEISVYLKQDCVVLYDLVAEYRKVAGKKITIAGNALAFSKSLGIDPGKTNHTYDTNFRPYFFGGRCQVFKPGTHKNIRIIDIHSAYPYAMTHDHPCGNEVENITPEYFNGLTRAEKQRCFIRLRCNSRGAFPLRSATELLFPNIYAEFHVTGWEYIAAIELGLIDRVQLLGIKLHRETINFSDYVTHWYEYKSSHDKTTQPIQYTIGKIMMNSLYGKLAQNPARYFDYKIMPAGSACCSEFVEGASATICECGEQDINHGWEIYTEYEGVEIHRRSALWKYKFRYGKAWEGQPLYNNVATGASITGFTRAHLLRAAHAVGIENVIYTDTDSIICGSGADLSKVSMTDKLGDWGNDGEGILGHFAGKKVYGIQLNKICKVFKGLEEECADCEAPAHNHGNSPKLKIASKGSKIKYSDVEYLVTGKTTGHKRQRVNAEGERIVVWQNNFPSFSVAGNASFVVRNIRSTATPILANN